MCTCLFGIDGSLRNTENKSPLHYNTMQYSSIRCVTNDNNTRDEIIESINSKEPLADLSELLFHAGFDVKPKISAQKQHRDALGRQMVQRRTAS